MNRIYFLVHDEARKRAMEDVRTAPEGEVVRIGEATRSLEANAAQWPILAAFSKQKQWPVNGKLETLTADEWKHVLSAAFEKENVRLAQGLDGGVVMLGGRTSKFGKKKFSDWLDFLNAAAVELDVKL